MRTEFSQRRGGRATQTCDTKASQRDKLINRTNSEDFEGFGRGRRAKGCGARVSGRGQRWTSDVGQVVAANLADHTVENWGQTFVVLLMRDVCDAICAGNVSDHKGGRTRGQGRHLTWQWPAREARRRSQRRRQSAAWSGQAPRNAMSECTGYRMSSHAN